MGTSKKFNGCKLRNICKKVTPSEQCRAAGLASLAELSRISGESVQTLINWHKNKPTLFALVISGAVVSSS